MTKQDTYPARRERYIALLDELGIDPDDNFYSGAEDAGLVLDGDPDYPLHRWAAVTYSGEFVYVTLHATFEGAAEYAIANVADTLYAEAPGEIRDLDSGCAFTPDWDSLKWKRGPVGPCTGAQS